MKNLLKKKVDENIEVEKLTNWQIIKAWIASAAQDLKNSLKHGGWRGAAAGFAVASVGMTFAACEVEKVNVQITEVGLLDQIQTMLGENFSVSEQIKTAAAQKFGNNLVSLMSENTNGSGKIVAFYQEDGMLKKATTQVELKANDFDAKIYEYGTFTEEGNTLSFYQNNQEQTVDTTGKFVSTLPEGLAVIDTRVAETKIANAISAMQSQELNLQTDLDEVGKEDFKTLLGFVIEKDQTAHLPTLSLEYDRASNQTTATYSYLSLAGQTKIESGNIVFEGNLIENDSLNRTAAEEQLQTERAVIRANRASVLEEATYTTLFELDNFDSNSVELEVAEKGDGNEDPGDNIPDPITFNSWEEVFALGDGTAKDAIVKTLQENLLTDTQIKRIFGNDMTVADLSNGTIDLIKWGFDIQDNQISSINLLGVRKGYPTEQSRMLRGSNFSFATPISLDGIVAMPVLEGSANSENSISIFINGVEYSIDLTQVASASEQYSHSYGFVYDSTAEITDQENLDFFNICTPLAAAAGNIDAGTKLSFVMVQGAGGTTAEFGTVYGVTIRAVDLQNNQLYNLRFIFDDPRTSIATSTVDMMKDAISRGQFSVFDNGREEIMPENDIVLEYPSDITEYSIPAQEKENAN